MEKEASVIGNEVKELKRQLKEAKQTEKQNLKEEKKERKKQQKLAGTFPGRGTDAKSSDERRKEAEKRAGQARSS